ncbi:hypothetical protein QGP82_01655 [Leptothoe sp. LEGE 181152]|uniref:hypothetical protein n=1 Tax=Adonisia turfae TaxID=2950184 RepID=UPI0013D078FA|nr:hypothetical protein [Adonisia turfae]MDV3347387.1 hypothetical protein [Leptothoe sp. LEGE 181152]
MGLSNTTELSQMIVSSTHIIHIFDREGDIAEVLYNVNNLRHTGVVVWADTIIF